MKALKSHLCVICGERPATTVDHVPPKGLFKGVVNAQLRTVPACSDCNNGASSDDEDVRFFVSAQIGKQNPASKALWEQGAHKSIKRKTALRESFVATARDMQVVGNDGTVATRLAFNIPVRTYQRVFERHHARFVFLSHRTYSSCRRTYVCRHALRGCEKIPDW